MSAEGAEGRREEDATGKRGGEWYRGRLYDCKDWVEDDDLLTFALTMDEQCWFEPDSSSLDAVRSIMTGCGRVRPADVEPHACFGPFMTGLFRMTISW
jgi:hypothetical protein